MGNISINQQKILKLFKSYKRNIRNLNIIRNLQNNGRYGVVIKEGNETYITNNECKKRYDTFKEFDMLMMKENLENYIYLRDILYKQLNNDEKKLVDYKFNENCTVFQVMTKMFISESQYYRMSRRMYEKLNNYYETFEVLFK